MTNVSNLKKSSYKNALTCLELNSAKLAKANGEYHLTRCSRNQAEKMIIEIWICPKIATIHAIILKGHINSGYDTRVPQCTLHSPGHVFDKPTYCHMIVILPDFNQGVGKLLGCLVRVWKQPKCVDPVDP